MRKKLLLLILIIIGLGFAFYSKDLKQENPETVFLTTDGIKKYQAFKELVPERKIVIFKIDLTEKLTPSAYNRFKHSLKPTFGKYEKDFDFLLPEDLYPSTTKFVSALKDPVAKQGQLNLFGEKFLAFLAIEKETKTKFHGLIDEVKDTFVNNLSIAGIPFTNYLLDKYSKSIKEKVFPTMFAVSFVLILLITKSFLTSLFLFIPCLFSSTICLSYIKALHGSMNMVTSIIPLMCFTITLAMVFHLYFMMRRTNDFSEAARKKLPPIILMIITTCIGFGSLAISDIQAISTFGKLSAVLILITSLYTFLFLYSSESYLLKDTKHRSDFSSLQSYFASSFSFRTISIITFISLTLGGVLLTKINIITDATRYFPKSSGLKSSIDSVNNSVAGLPLYDLILELKQQDLEGLKRLEKIENDLSAQMKSVHGFKGVISLNSMIKSANKEYAGKAKLPNHILAFQTLRSRLKPSIRDSFPFEKNYKISLMGTAVNVDEYEKGISIIKNYFSKIKQPYILNGLYYNLMISQKSMISVLFKSFLIALFIVSIIALLYLKQPRIFFIFLFVNIVPVFASFIIMFLFNFSINIATVMTYSIALGMIVDSSFHLIHNLKERKTTSYEEYFETTVVPIIGSSLLLIGSFSLFGLNGFLPIKQFGINLSIILFFGMVFDLYILPTLFLGNNRIKEAFDVSNI